MVTMEEKQALLDGRPQPLPAQPRSNEFCRCFVCAQNARPVAADEWDQWKPARDIA